MPSKSSRSGPTRPSAGLDAGFDEWAKDWNTSWESRPRTIGEAVKRCRGMTLDACRQLGATVVIDTTEVRKLAGRQRREQLRGFSLSLGRFCAVLWPETMLSRSESRKRVADIGRALAALEAADLRLRGREEGMAAMELVAFGRHCQQTFWRRAEPFVERGVKQIERSRAGLIRAFGTPEKRMSRDRRIKEAWMRLRRGGVPVARCDREVATKSGVSVRTVQRARRRT